MNTPTKNILTIVFFSFVWSTLVSYITWIPDIIVNPVSNWDIGAKILLAVAVFAFDLAMVFLVSYEINVLTLRFVAWFLCMLSVFIVFTSVAVTFKISALILALNATGLMFVFKAGLLFLKQKEVYNEQIINIKYIKA